MVREKNLADEQPDLDEPWRLSPKLKWELEMVLSGQIETCRELDLAVDHLNSAPLSQQFAHDAGVARAHELRQAAVLEVWRMIADGTANIAEKDIWVSAVAKHIVDHVLTVPAELRARAALKSIGLTQTLGKNLELKIRLELEEELGPGAMLPHEFFEMLRAEGPAGLEAHRRRAEEAKPKLTRAEKARIARIKKKRSS